MPAHQTINFKNTNTLWLLVLDYIGSYLKLCCSSIDKNIMYKVYQKGVAEIEKELDIIKIIK